MELIRGLFITVEVNGEVVDVDVEDIKVETEGDTTTLTVDLSELSGDVQEGVATITVDADVDEAVMTVAATTKTKTVNSWGSTRLS